MFFNANNGDTTPWVIPAIESFDISSQETTVSGLDFKPDGTKMYICGTAVDSIFQYSLSTAFDIETASYDSVSQSIATNSANPRGLRFSPDGTKVFVADSTNSGITQYTLSSAWDITTASFASKRLDSSGEATNEQGLAISTDGTKAYVVDAGNDRVYQYSLSTAFDMSTDSYDSKSLDVSSYMAQPTGVEFKPDGTRCFVIGYTSSTSAVVVEFSLSTAWDISTTTHENTRSVYGEVATPVDIKFNPNGLSYFVPNDTSDDVFQYNL